VVDPSEGPGRVFGPKREDVTGDWRKLRNEEPPPPPGYYLGEEGIEDEIGGACGTYEREKCIQGIGGET
jgi:hypothetical protein